MRERITDNGVLGIHQFDAVNSALLLHRQTPRRPGGQFRAQ